MPQVIYRKGAISFYYPYLGSIIFTLFVSKLGSYYHSLFCLCFEFRFYFSTTIFYFEIILQLLFYTIWEKTWKIVLELITEFFPIFYKDTTICTGCCSILDNIVSHIFKQLSIKGKIYSLFIANSPTILSFNSNLCDILPSKYSIPDQKVTSQRY